MENINEAHGDEGDEAGAIEIINGSDHFAEEVFDNPSNTPYSQSTFSFLQYLLFCLYAVPNRELASSLAITLKLGYMGSSQSVREAMMKILAHVYAGNVEEAKNLATELAELPGTAFVSALLTTMFNNLALTPQ